MEQEVKASSAVVLQPMTVGRDDHYCFAIGILQMMWLAVESPAHASAATK